MRVGSGITLGLLRINDDINFVNEESYEKHFDYLDYEERFVNEND